MKRKYALLLALLMLLPSCAAEPEETEAVTSASADTTVPETETEKLYLDNIPEGVTFGGSNFNILIREEKVNDTISEEMIGEIVNDAIAERTLMLEDRFDIEFGLVPLPFDAGTWTNTIAASVQASDGAYDVVLPDYWWGIELGGYFMDLNQIESFDFDREYWCSGWNENTEFFGKLYTAVGDWSLDLIGNTMGIYFNKTIIEEAQLENPYDLVKSGDWYHDTFYNMAESVVTDLNGDGRYQLGTDRMGVSYQLHGGRGFLYCYGVEFGKKDANGGWTLDYYDERFVDIYNTVYDMHNKSLGVTYSFGDAYPTMFASGYELFMVNTFYAARGTALRDMEDDFGIVPYPKFDEQQEDYLSYNLGTSYMAITKSSLNPEMSAVVMEALSAANHKTVIPVLYEDALKDKYSRDPITAEMLDIMQSRVRFDFAYVHEASLAKGANKYFDAIVSKRPVASTHQGVAKLNERCLKNLLEIYAEME